MDSYQFYRVAPDRMMLVTTGLDLSEFSLDSVESQLPPFYSALDLLKKKRVDRIALSGVLIAAAMGRPACWLCLRWLDKARELNVTQI
jgi:hypothetical protein